MAILPLDSAVFSVDHQFRVLVLADCAGFVHRVTLSAKVVACLPTTAAFDVPATFRIRDYMMIVVWHDVLDLEND